jgi:hypothetical protein
MRRTTGFMMSIAAVAGLLLAALGGGVRAACTGCTGGCRECVPACRGSWEEKKSTKTKYSMACEYACVRGSDSWHAPPPECRCHPPCGDVIVKKRFYKTDGPEQVERVPKYEVRMVAAEPCDTCDGGGGEQQSWWWTPFAALRRCGDWW